MKVKADDVQVSMLICDQELHVCAQVPHLARQVEILEIGPLPCDVACTVQYWEERA